MAAQEATEARYLFQSARYPMLRAIVMQEWGLDGILCTDGGGLRLLVSDHKAFPDLPAAAAACVKAGINFFLDRHKEAVTEAVKRGLPVGRGDRPGSPRPLPGLSAPGPVGSTRARALREDRQGRRPRAVGAARDPRPRSRGHAQVDRPPEELGGPPPPRPHEGEVLVVSFPVALPWAAANAPTILQVTHSSRELGNGLADVLFGDANPGGRLVQTWPKVLEDLPPMMDYDLRHGRTYMYFRGEPQYAFGTG